MGKKRNHTKKLSTKKLLRFLPLFGVVIGLFIALIGLLLWLGKLDRTVPAVGLFEPYPKIEAKAAVKDTVVDKILVEVGEEVEGGQVLMHLKDQEQSSEKVAQLKEMLKLANINRERLRRLADKGYVAVRDKEEAGLKIKVLEQDLRAHEQRMKALVITAASAGTVVRIPVKVGDRVDMGQELALLAVSAKRALRLWVKEEDSSEIKVGQVVRIYSQIFYYRKHGIALGRIVEIDAYPRSRGGVECLEAVVQITESPFPLRIGSQAEARIVIERCSIFKLLCGLE